MDGFIYTNIGYLTRSKLVDLKIEQKRTFLKSEFNKCAFDHIKGII